MVRLGITLAVLPLIAADMKNIIVVHTIPSDLDFTSMNLRKSDTRTAHFQRKERTQAVGDCSDTTTCAELHKGNCQAALANVTAIEIKKSVHCGRCDNGDASAPQAHWCTNNKKAIFTVSYSIYDHTVNENGYWGGCRQPLGQCDGCARLSPGEWGWQPGRYADYRGAELHPHWSDVPASEEDAECQTSAMHSCRHDVCTWNVVYRKEFTEFTDDFPDGCADDANWDDSQFGDGTRTCSDLRTHRDWCMDLDVEGYGRPSGYGSEARRACPVSCGLCEETYVV